MYLEKDFQSDFTRWWRMNAERYELDQSTAIELKCKKHKEPLALYDFEDQQIPALQRTKTECVSKKLSDADRTLKPFDFFTICHAKNAWIAVLFYEARKEKQFYLIDVDDYLLAIASKSSSRGKECKSLKEEEIARIGTKYKL